MDESLISVQAIHNPQNDLVLAQGHRQCPPGAPGINFEVEANLHDDLGGGDLRWSDDPLIFLEEDG